MIEELIGRGEVLAGQLDSLQMQKLALRDGFVFVQFLVLLDDLQGIQVFVELTEAGFSRNGEIAHRAVQDQLQDLLGRQEVVRVGVKRELHGLGLEGHEGANMELLDP